MRITRILKEDLDLFGILAYPFLLRGLEYDDGKYTIGDLFDELGNGDKQAWLVYNDKEALGCVVTEIIKYPRQNRLGIFLCSGNDFDQWYPLRKDIYQWAKQFGCTSCEFYGRKGWIRKLKEYKLLHVCMKEKIE